MIDQLVPLELVQRREQLAWALERLLQLDQRLVVKVGRRTKLTQREPQQHRAADRSSDQMLGQFWGRDWSSWVTNVRASAGAVVTTEGRPSSWPSGKLPSCVCSW